jgi:hypothetical protein
MKFIDPPHELGQELGPSLRSSMPKRISIDRALEDNVYIVELSKRYSCAVLPVIFCILLLIFLCSVL